MFKTYRNNILQVAASGYTPDPRGTGYVYYECMLKHKQKVAQIYGPTGEEDTYGDFLQRCVRVAIAMQKRGVKRSDFVSVCTDNHLNSATPVISSLFIGAIMAAVDYDLTVEDISDLLVQAVPKIIFVKPEFVELIEKSVRAIRADTEIVVFGNTTKHTPFSEFLVASYEEANFKPIVVNDLQDTAMVFFTSGTTGMPKAISHNHSSMLHQYYNIINLGLNLDLFLEYTSPYWTVFAAFLGTTIVLGTTRLIYSEFDSENVWMFKNFNVTGMFLSTTEVLTMCKIGCAEDEQPPKIKDIIIGGSALSNDQMHRIKNLFCKSSIYLVYGQTEVPGPLLSFNAHDPSHYNLMMEKPTSVGTGIPGISYKIVDIKTEKPLGPNRRGELRIKTVFPLGGYFNKNSSALWDSNCWLKTGDLAYYDEDYCFYVISRIKDMFKYQCFHIIPSVLQNLLLKHPAVEKAAVLGIPHEIDGAHPMGVVILKPSHQFITEKEIEKYIEDQVHESHRLRAGVKFVNSFPTTPTGKVKRKALKEMIMNECF